MLDVSLPPSSEEDATGRPAECQGERGERLKELVVPLFGEDRYVGTFPTRLHSDLRHLIEMYRRGKQPRLAAARLEALEVALAASAKNGAKHLPSSFGELRAHVEEWRAGARRGFDAETYYDKERAAGYTEHNRGPQEALTRRTLELASFSSDRPKTDAKATFESVLAVDLGCGSGLSTLGAVTLPGYTLGVIGVDLSSEMLRSDTWKEVASARAPLAGERVRFDLAHPLPFRTGIFDAAFSVGTVHYLAQDAVHRSAASRLDAFTGSLRRCLTEDARPVVCQAFLTREPFAVDEFKKSALRTGWALCDLVLDKTHSGNTTERDFLYMLPKAPASDKVFTRPPRCAIYNDRHATCLLALRQWAQGNCVAVPCVDAAHHAWLEREHDRFGKRLVRLQGRCATPGAKLDHAEPLDDSGRLKAERLASLYAASEAEGTCGRESDPEGTRLSHIIAALHDQS